MPAFDIFRSFRVPLTVAETISAIESIEKIHLPLRIREIHGVSCRMRSLIWPLNDDWYVEITGYIPLGRSPTDSTANLPALTCIRCTSNSSELFHVFHISIIRRSQAQKWDPSAYPHPPLARSRSQETLRRDDGSG